MCSSTALPPEKDRWATFTDMWPLGPEWEKVCVLIEQHSVVSGGVDVRTFAIIHRALCLFQTRWRFGMIWPWLRRTSQLDQHVAAPVSPNADSVSTVARCYSLLSEWPFSFLLYCIVCFRVFFLSGHRTRTPSHGCYAAFTIVKLSLMMPRPLRQIRAKN